MIKFLLLSLTLTLCCFSGLGQSAKASLTPTPSDEPVLLPLTDEEQNIDVRASLLNQPDYLADEGFFYWEGFGGMRTSSKVGRLGDRSYNDNGFFIFLKMPGMSYRLDPKRKTFEAMPILSDDKVSPGSPLDIQQLAKRDGVEFIPLGAQVIDEHRCIKVEARIKGETVQVLLYLAKDLKNLVIASQVILGPRSSTTRLANISLTASKEMFEIPAGYKPLGEVKKSTSGKIKTKH